MRIVLIGGGDRASDILGVLEALSQSTKIIEIFADTEIDSSGFRHRGGPQIGDLSDLKRVDASHYIVAVDFSHERGRLPQSTAHFGLPRRQSSIHRQIFQVYPRAKGVRSFIGSG